MGSRGRSLLVAVLFLASGLLTYWMYSWTEAHFREHNFVSDTFYELWIGLPFGVLSAVLWVRSSVRIPLVVLLECMAWSAAHWTALYLGGHPGWTNGFVNMAIAGLVGGTGVALAMGIGCVRVRSVAFLLGGAIVGAIAAIPFGQLADAAGQGGIVYNPNDQTVLAISFPLWQVTVGLWLFAFAESGSKQSLSDAPSAVPDAG